jgi:hypothetical protein
VIAPAPTPDPSSDCAAFDLCRQCVDETLHPGKSCRFCGAVCQPTAADCASEINAADVVQCPTNAPVWFLLLLIDQSFFLKTEKIAALTIYLLLIDTESDTTTGK